MTMDNDAAFIEGWLLGKRPGTVRAYRLALKQLFKSVGPMSLRCITVEHISAFLQALEPCSIKTSSQKLGIMKSLFREASRRQVVEKDLLRFAPLPRVERDLPRILEAADIKGMIELEPIARNRVLISLIYTVGLRVGETVNLRWCDLKLTAGGGVVGGGVLMIGGPNARSVEIPDAIAQMLLAARAGGTDLIFPSPRGGGPLDNSSLHRVIKIAARRIDLDVSAKLLRNAHVNHALANGAPAKLVQRSVGHSSISSTLRLGPDSSSPGGSARFIR